MGTGVAVAAVGQCWSASLCVVECVSTEEPRLSDGAIVCEPQGCVCHRSCMRLLRVTHIFCSYQPRDQDVKICLYSAHISVVTDITSLSTMFV